MKQYIYTLLLTIAVPLSSYSQAHTVMLRSGNFTPAATTMTDVHYSQQELVNGRYYRFIQFKQIPSEAEKAALKAKGIDLYNYLPDNTYMAAIPASLNLNTISTENIHAVFAIEPQHKMDKYLSAEQYPEWALQGANEVELVITHHPGLNHDHVKEMLAANGIQALNSLPEINAYSIVANKKDILAIAVLPYLYFVELTDGAPVAENLVGKTSHRSNTIANEYATGLKFDGSGVNVALNDDGVIGPHIDYTGRLIDQYITFNNGDHGDHCAGILFGAGNRNPTTRGMASGANLGVYGVGPFSTAYQAFDSINNHYNSKNIRITSTSYGNGNNAGYTTLARLMDVQANSMRELTHVFSAGNSGTSDYGYGAGAGWGNITGGHKQAKNVIAVANLDYQDNLSGSSSRGPAYDGRIKPDISAVGSSVYSTIDPNNYVSNSGTSMACPAIAGVAAQLYQAYKEMNNGANPQAALIKATMLNTADDIGNPGPDFKHGWGRVNARRAYKLLAAKTYLTDTVANAANKNHTITVPANTAELRVMLYWQDYEATANAGKALVNDLNMSVIDPATQTILPWKLNHAANATSLNLNATKGVDALNNMEQVTVNAPVAGNYTVNVNGFSVPQGPQAYYIVYELVKDEIVVTYPMGGESLVPTVSETIRWDAFGATGTFTLEYSINNGNSWTTIASGIAGTTRHYNWTVPSSVTGQALVKVSRGAVSDLSDAAFSIINVPSGLQHNWSCIDSMEVTYNTVTGATGYIISILGDKYMDSVGYSTTGTCVVKNIDTRKGGWFSVQAVGPNGCIGRWANAVTYAALPSNCTAPQDVALISFSSPTTATVISCGAPQVNDPVKVILRNNSFGDINSIPLRYSVNNGTPAQSTSSATVSAGNYDTVSFFQALNINTPGTYTIKAWLDFSSTQNSTTPNDTITIQKAVIASTPQKTINEDFETFTPCSTTADCDITICPAANNWVNEHNSVDGIDWRITSGPTPTRTATSQTGPMLDAKPGTAIGKYAYLEASQCPGKEAYLILPCMDVKLVGSGIALLFSYHMFGSNMGELHVDILENGVWTNDVIPAITGNKGDKWNQESVPLNSYNGKIINIRFRGKTGAGENSDIAIDDIQTVIFGNVGGNTMPRFDCSVYPNPNNGQFTLSMTGSQSASEISISDISGKPILQTRVAASQTTINHPIELGAAAPGVYIMTVKNELGTKYLKLIVK